VSGVHQYSGTPSVQFIFDILPPGKKRNIMQYGRENRVRSFKKRAVVSVRRSLWFSESSKSFSLVLPRYMFWFFKGSLTRDFPLQVFFSWISLSWVLSYAAPLELHSTLRYALPFWLTNPLSSVSPFWATLHVSELRCIHLSYASPSELRQILIELQLL
jgi:hypothetical protein